MHSTLRNTLGTDPFGTLQLLHDIKAPLTALRILRTREQLGAPEQDLLRATIQRLEGLLAMAAGEVSLDRVVLGATQVKRLCLELAGQYQLVSGVPVEVMFDLGQEQISISSSELMRILSNLLDNSVRAAKATAGLVRIHVCAQEGFIRLEISDTGAGFDGPQKTSGWGMGLRIVQAIVRQNKGRMSLRSALAKGTTAIIQLPLALA